MRNGPPPNTIFELGFSQSLHPPVLSRRKFPSHSGHPYNTEVHQPTCPSPIEAPPTISHPTSHIPKAWTGVSDRSEGDVQVFVACECAQSMARRAAVALACRAERVRMWLHLADPTDTVDCVCSSHEFGIIGRARRGEVESLELSGHLRRCMRCNSLAGRERKEPGA